ncbi:hypothetical protein RERY_07520 [Rhodococcus erythropolis]|nr:hypothetical protein RERY_07520 [Rhodococcus erythropolis]
MRGVSCILVSPVTIAPSAVAGGPSQALERHDEHRKKRSNDDPPCTETQLAQGGPGSAQRTAQRARRRCPVDSRRFIDTGPDRFRSGGLGSDHRHIQLASLAGYRRTDHYHDVCGDFRHRFRRAHEGGNERLEYRNRIRLYGRRFRSYRLSGLAQLRRSARRPRRDTALAAASDSGIRGSRFSWAAFRPSIDFEAVLV